MAPTAKQMGTTLRKLRIQKQLSQAALAKRVDLSREYINKLEAGKYDPPLSTLNALAKALGVPVTELLE